MAPVVFRPRPSVRGDDLITFVDKVADDIIDLGHQLVERILEGAGIAQEHPALDPDRGVEAEHLDPFVEVEFGRCQHDRIPGITLRIAENPEKRRIHRILVGRPE